MEHKGADYAITSASDAVNSASNLLGTSTTTHATAQIIFVPTHPQTQQHFGTTGLDKIWIRHCHILLVPPLSFHQSLQHIMIMSVDQTFPSHPSLLTKTKYTHHLTQHKPPHRVQLSNLREHWLDGTKPPQLAPAQIVVTAFHHDNMPTTQKMLMLWLCTANSSLAYEEQTHRHQIQSTHQHPHAHVWTVPEVFDHENELHARKTSTSWQCITNSMHVDGMQRCESSHLTNGGQIQQWDIYPAETGTSIPRGIFPDYFDICKGSFDARDVSPQTAIAKKSTNYWFASFATTTHVSVCGQMHQANTTVNAVPHKAHLRKVWTTTTLPRSLLCHPRHHLQQDQQHRQGVPEMTLAREQVHLLLI